MSGQENRLTHDVYVRKIQSNYLRHLDLQGVMQHVPFVEETEQVRLACVHSTNGWVNKCCRLVSTLGGLKELLLCTLMRKCEHGEVDIPE